MELKKAGPQGPAFLLLPVSVRVDREVNDGKMPSLQTREQGEIFLHELQDGFSLPDPGL